MNFKIVFCAGTYLAIFQLAQSQCLNRALPIAESLLSNQALFGPNIIDFPIELLPNGQFLPRGQILPNGQILSRQMLPGPILPNGQIVPNLLPGPMLPNILPNQFIPNVVPSQIVSGPVLPPILPGTIAPTTIIQDGTVANNLANALQLLVVSNLLANKLPYNDVIPAPVEFLPPVGPCGFGGYNVVY